MHSGRAKRTEVRRIEPVQICGGNLTELCRAYDCGHKFMTAVIGRLAASPSAEFERPKYPGTRAVDIVNSRASTIPVSRVLP